MASSLSAARRRARRALGAPPHRPAIAYAHPPHQRIERATLRAALRHAAGREQQSMTETADAFNTDQDFSSSVFVGESDVHGRGVFAARPFEAGDVIEDCPVIVFGAEEVEHLEETSLRGYYFEWADEGVGLALGLGSLYNHSASPNAAAEADYDLEIVRYTAIGRIEAGAEVVFDYTGNGDVELWFDPIDPIDD
jgi:hypothetical protein